MSLTRTWSQKIIGTVAMLLALVLAFMSLPLEQTYADSQWLKSHGEGKAPSRAINIGEKAVVYTFPPLQNNTAPDGKTYIITAFDPNPLPEVFQVTGGAGVSNMKRIWVRMNDDVEFTAYCIAKALNYPNDIMIFDDATGTCQYTLDQAIQFIRNGQLITPNGESMMWTVEAWPASANYDAILWVLEHSYPSLPIDVMLKDAGTSYDQLSQEIGAYYSKAANEANFLDMGFSSFEEGHEYHVKSFVYGVVQMAIWYHEGVNNYTQNAVSRFPSLLKLYHYLTKDREEYSNYRNYQYGTDIAINTPDEMKPVRTTDADSIGVGDLYGPFSISTSLLSPGDVDLTLSVIGNDALAAQLIKATKNSSGTVTSHTPLTTARVEEEFYVFVPGGAYQDFDCSISASADNAYTMVGQGRGRMITPDAASLKGVIQQVGIGGNPTTTTAEDTITLPTFLAGERISVEIYKTDDESTPIEGATIVVKKADTDTEVARGTTNAQGVFTAENLEPGDYTVYEAEAPAGYIKDGNEYFITIAEDGTVTGGANWNRKIINEPTSVTIHKKDEDTNAVLSGVRIGIYKAADDSLVSEHTTDTDGNITVEALPAGEYYAKEIAAPEGYILNTNEYPFTIHTNGTETGIVTIPNEKEPFAVTLTKTDAATGQGLSGATIVIKNAATQETVDTLTSGTNGTVTLELDPGNYVFYETAAPSGYELNNEQKQFTVAEDGTVTGTTTLTNRKAPMPVTLTKLAAGTTTKLAGAVFQVKDAAGDVVGNYTTGADGTVTFNVYPGTYTFTETTAPDGYELNTQQQTSTLR